MEWGKVPVVHTTGRVIPQFAKVKPVSVISDSHCAATVVKGNLRVELSDDISDQMLIKLMRILVMFKDSSEFRRIFIACGYTDLRYSFDRLANCYVMADVK